MKDDRINDINYALVEEKRPPIYTAMKYWGKKPHNIWNNYILNYTKNEGIYLDPFAGSAMSAFESFVAGKKAVALDLNPLTSFIIESICSPFDETKFIKIANEIIIKLESNPIYIKLYGYKANLSDYFVQNVKWNDELIYEICIESKDRKIRKCLKPTQEDYDAVIFSKNNIINKTYPHKNFRISDSFSNIFLEKIGTCFSDLYTKRNLWILSELFDEILCINDKVVKQQLLFAFIQIVHLSTKMCVPRSKKTNRDFSTSWGRSAFLYSKKQMEMNPLLLFKNCCFGKQSVLSCLNFAKKYFKRTPIISNLNDNKFFPKDDIDIWYGVVDIKQIDKILPEKSISFILTDPPYGGLVQYLDLSTVWLSWLELYDKKYSPNYDDEITINGKKDIAYFEESMSCALKKLNKLLIDSGKLILTFNNKDIKIWSSLLRAIENAGFRIEKVIHQQNKRTSESNVSDPYGMSASDYYIRCIKSSCKYLINMNKEEIENILLQKAIKIIVDRAEPTPYQILFNGLLAELSISNIDISSFDNSLESFFKNHLEVEFIIYKNATNKAGNYWWLKGKDFKVNSSKTLSNRVNKFVKSVFEKTNCVDESKILQLIFKKFPNGLTPDIECVYATLKEQAFKKNTLWIKR